MTSITRPRLSSMMQSSAISYGAYYLTGGQPVIRKPTIGAPEIVLAEQPATNLKRRSHIRRTSRSGTSPTSPDGYESQSPSTAFRRSRQDLPRLTTAFIRSAATSVSSGSVVTRQHTLLEHTEVQWRNSPQYQPKVVRGADLSRRSTVASVYSLPSAAPRAHESRRPTQENYILDWSVVDQALQNRAESPIVSPPFAQPFRDAPQRPYSIETHVQHVGGQTGSTSSRLSRADTAQVRSLIMDRQREWNVTNHMS